MALKYAILGFLSWQPLTGYDLKKMFADSTTLYWSGSNNQIYRTLVKLHREELVTREVEYQEDNPPRKIYTITRQGEAALRQWVLTPPELPQRKHTFLIQLLWADELNDDALDDLLSQYEEEVHVYLLMLRERQQRRPQAPARTPRETLLWDTVVENWIVHYETELGWVQRLRQSLQDLSPT